jgi:hypothetical protein
VGFRPPPTNIHLAWAEDHRLHGLEVYARGLRLGSMLDLATLYVTSGIAGKEDDADLSEEDIKLMLTMFRVLVGNDDECPPDGPEPERYKPGLIMSWNRDGDDGQPLPVSMRGIRQLELWEFQEIMSGYLESGGVKLEDPLSEGSKSGNPSPEQSAMTELESLSLTN